MRFAIRKLNLNKRLAARGAPVVDVRRTALKNPYGLMEGIHLRFEIRKDDASHHNQKRYYNKRPDEHAGCGFLFDPQYVARPPDRSNTAPVVKEFSADTIQAIMLAASSTSRNRARGILESM